MTAERLSITVPADCAQTIRELAERENTTISAEIKKALKAYINGTILGKMENAVVEAYEARIRSLEQRIKDKDEIIKSKDEIIRLLDEGAMRFPKKGRREKVVFTEDTREDG